MIPLDGELLNLLAQVQQLHLLRSDMAKEKGLGEAKEEGKQGWSVGNVDQPIIAEKIVRST